MRELASDVRVPSSMGNSGRHPKFGQLYIYSSGQCHVKYLPVTARSHPFEEKASAAEQSSPIKEADVTTGLHEILSNM